MDNEDELERPASVRRTFTLRNNAARQVAVNFMPSRQLSYNTLRLRRINSEHNAFLEGVCDSPDAGDADTRADMIVREMEQHQRLMEDDPEAEQLRREALRDLPQGMTMKRSVRAKLSASVSLRSKRRPISTMKRLKYRIAFAYKRFRGRLRDLVFSVELWYEAIRNIEGHFGSAVGSYFYLVRWLFAMDLALAAVLVALVVVPQALHDAAGGSANVTSSRGFWDIVNGKALDDTLLFYGHYHYGDIATSGPLTYNMPFAYFFTMVCLYLASFGVLCYRTAYSYRRNFIETADGLSHAFASKLFCGWDFGIATEHAAALNANSIYNEFKEILTEQNKRREGVSIYGRVWRAMANMAAWCVVGGVGVGVAVGVWALGAQRLLVAALLAGAAAVGPLLFTLLVRLEFYEPRTKIYVTLARTWLLDLGLLMVLLVYWSQSETPCWETVIGQEAYRLIILDAVVSLVIVPAIEGVRGLIFKFNPSTAAPEFNIAYNSLTLIYNQAVLWFGMLFSPLLVVAVTIKFLCLFYVKRAVAIRACQPARKVWRAAQTQTIFFMLVTLSLFATLFALGSLFFWSESVSCGPFRAYGRVYAVVGEGVLRLSQRETARRVLTFITRPGALAFAMLALCVFVYQTRARAQAQRSLARRLRRMLLLQAKDKDFLLAAIDKVSHGEWLYSPKDPAEGPDSHTWKYLKEVRKPSNAEFNFDPSRVSHSIIEGRPRSYIRSNSYMQEKGKTNDDGDTDSSFSWQGSSNYLNQRGDVEDGEKKWL